LPAGAILVDYLEYERTPRRASKDASEHRRERHLLAFVIRKGREPVRVKLGPARDVSAAVDAWRRARGRTDGARLRRLVWDPVRAHVGDAKLVLVSPDGALGRLPFSALPGEEPGTFLLEEISIAVLPVPRLLPSMLRRKASTGAVSLLLVGDVDYGEPDGSNPLLEKPFERLPGTRGEILTIRDSFEERFEDGDLTVLRRKRATEDAFLEAAAKHRWLHVATHGFFAPATLRSALARRDPAAEAAEGLGRSGIVGRHPGLLSGLALAGANASGEGGVEDGILTALEVAGGDLSGVDVVVLSACETGLGLVAAGEGALGLQRAFQMSGARTTVASLWRVPDDATSRLMQLFYENVWGRGLSRLEALRAAKLELLRGEAGRGLTREEGEGDAESRSPFLWAGFVLSGDWR
jgi:CHAT domain-containing protein